MIFMSQSVTVGTKHLDVFREISPLGVYAMPIAPRFVPSTALTSGIGNLLFLSIVRFTPNRTAPMMPLTESVITSRPLIVAFVSSKIYAARKFALSSRHTPIIQHGGAVVECQSSLLGDIVQSPLLTSGHIHPYSLPLFAPAAHLIKCLQHGLSTFGDAVRNLVLRRDY